LRPELAHDHKNWILMGVGYNRTENP
jgi:hypothetical protein